MVADDQTLPVHNLVDKGEACVDRRGLLTVPEGERVKARVDRGLVTKDLNLPVRDLRDRLALDELLEVFLDIFLPL